MRVRTVFLVPLAGCAAATDGVSARVAALEADMAGLVDRVSALEADVSDALAALATLDEVVAGLSTDPHACPTGMVPVGDFCVDQWKASVWDDPACDGEGIAYGAESADFPATFPESGDWSEPLYACSIEGVVPAGNLTWFQASQACALSGKSLCTNAQWQTAVAGTPSDESACALSTGEPVATGSFPECVSNWDTYDQVGIRWEWTAEWGSGGATWMTTEDADGARALPWPESYGDGLDYTLNVNGEAMGAGVMTPGLPAATIRGGDYSNGSEGGSFALSRARGPSHIAPYIGFRCCVAR